MLKVEPFYLQRDSDVTGVSGIGIVALGAKFSSGRVIIEWQSFTKSFSIFDTMEHLIEVHSHNGSTKVIMGHPPDTKKKRKNKNDIN